MPETPPGPGTGRAAEVSTIVQLIQQRIPGAEGEQLASEFDAYAAAHPKETAQQAYLAWFLQASKLAPHLFNDLGTGLGAPGQLAQAGENALTSLNPLAGLFQANLWIRVGEVIVGLVLLAVGVAKLTNAVPAATKIASIVK